MDPNRITTCDALVLVHPEFGISNSNNDYCNRLKQNVYEFLDYKKPVFVMSTGNDLFVSKLLQTDRLNYLPNNNWRSEDAANVQVEYIRHVLNQRKGKFTTVGIGGRTIGGSVVSWTDSRTDSLYSFTDNLEPYWTKRKVLPRTNNPLSLGIVLEELTDLPEKRMQENSLKK